MGWEPLGLCLVSKMPGYMRLLPHALCMAGPPCSLHVSASQSVHCRAEGQLLGNVNNFKVRLSNRIWSNFVPGLWSLEMIESSGNFWCLLIFIYLYRRSSHFSFSPGFPYVCFRWGWISPSHLASQCVHCSGTTIFQLGIPCPRARHLHPCQYVASICEVISGFQ